MRRAAARVVLVVAALVAACAGTNGGVAVRSVFVVPGAGLAPGVLYATIDNAGAAADTLTGIEMEDGSSVMLHDNLTDAVGRTTMQPLQRLVVPPQGRLLLRPGGVHGMVGRGATRPDSVRVTFWFSRGGEIAARAMVIDYAQVDSAVGRGGR